MLILSKYHDHITTESFFKAPFWVHPKFSGSLKIPIEKKRNACTFYFLYGTDFYTSTCFYEELCDKLHIFKFYWWRHQNGTLAPFHRYLQFLYHLTLRVTLYEMTLLHEKTCTEDSCYDQYYVYQVSNNFRSP